MISADLIPEGFLPWHLPGGDTPLGYVRTSVADILCAARLMRTAGNGLILNGDATLTNRLEMLRAELCRAQLVDAPRGEHMPVCLAPGAVTLATIDRSAIRALGLWVVKVHVNGLVRRADADPDVWLSRRSLSASAAPGTLDTFVAGGQPASMSVKQTMVKESAEEVGVNPELARTAQPVGRLDLTYPGADGLHREQLAIFDLHLPPEFVPVHHDGEISQSLRLGWSEFGDAVAAGVDFKHSSLAVCRDLIRRRVGLEEATPRPPRSAAP
jgi:8-oxo-dGTP pyrophosphatase MutT (NUDIX family)